MDFSVGSKPLRPDAECIISAIQASQKKVVFVNFSIYYSALVRVTILSLVSVSGNIFE